MWQELIEVLTKICAVYEDLGKIGERKRDALVAVDMKGLAKILDEEQLAAAKIQNLEKTLDSTCKGRAGRAIYHQGDGEKP